MSTNWIDEAIRTKSGIKPFRLGSPAAAESRAVTSVTATSAPGKASDGRTRFRWLLLLALNVQLAIVVSVPMPRAIASWLVFDRLRADVPTYELRRSGEVPLPTGIGELLYVGPTVVATTNPRWQLLSERERAGSLEALARWIEPAQELAAFEPTGRAVGRLRAGIVEVYP